MSQDFGGSGSPWGIFFGFYKTRHILLSDNANCTVLRAVVLTQYRRVTDGQTDGIAIASTALAMRALRRRAVIKLYYRVSGCDSWLSVGGPVTRATAVYYRTSVQQRRSEVTDGANDHGRSALMIDGD